MTGVPDAAGTSSLVDPILAAVPRALARLMRQLEDDDPEARAALVALLPHVGRAFVIGLTGPPGAGKSTLVDALLTAYRARGHKVGVVAVDPSSPLSGGALLGDRVRMQRHATDPGVFIRSLASRGNLGGLARSTEDVIDVLDAAGFDRILVETVGVGQDEMEVAKVADVAVIVTVPGLGDGVQALKSGLLEVADVFVVNKCDREGADRVEQDLHTMLALRGIGRKDVPILRTQAVTGEGVAELVACLETTWAHTSSSNEPQQQSRRAARVPARLRQAVLAAVQSRIDEAVGGDAGWQRWAAKMARGAATVDDVLAEVWPGPGGGNLTR